MRQGVKWLVVGAFVFHVGAALAAPPAPAPGEAGRTVRGEVSTVNESRGTLTIKTADGELDLRFPPAAVKGLRKGDHIVVRLAVVAGPGHPRHAPAASPMPEESKRTPAPKSP
jgi:hypothetical protein